ncbi:MAG: hypothetical protein AW06_001462 [Candidatus Accumulibacter cognatus]|uniref:Uncharacterized protein n=1 Tax=Candidatus Accumulibacter cognatus TaxID=2954383 RepID=A0A080MJH0_9PROT|nr:MAG: hypothetical protein AW06_001462 [Candidatus Accumulibacter cognatus]
MIGVLTSTPLAVALTVTLAGRVWTVPSAGAVRLTVGGVLPPFTVIVRAALVVTPPALSVARAVRGWLPAGTLFQVKV